MNRIVFCLILFFIVIAGIFISYSISKTRTENIMLNYHMPISSLKSQLVIFMGDEFSPCWIFRGEYENAITGATFDVYVSLFGNVISFPESRMGPSIKGTEEKSGIADEQNATR